MARTYHVWRDGYPTEPYVRWACDLTPARSGKYTMLTSDPDVADYRFLEGIAATFSKVHHGVGPGPSALNVRLMVAMDFKPGDPGYFENAVRLIPNSILRSLGKP